MQAQGADAFYKGVIAKAIIAKSTALGGTMTLEDLAHYHGEWVEAARTHYHGYELLELPPPSQAWAANEMLNVLQACVPQWAPGKTLASLGPTSPLYWHLLVEAKKLAYADLYQYNADPQFRGGSARPAAIGVLCGIAVRQGRSGACVHAGTRGEFLDGRRHDRAFHRGWRRQHGLVGQQQFR